MCDKKKLPGSGINRTVTRAKDKSDIETQVLRFTFYVAGVLQEQGRSAGSVIERILRFLLFESHPLVYQMCF